jgi:hypothetical protein
MTLEQAIEKINEAIRIARLRKESTSESTGYFDDSNNVRELLFAIDYELNPPIKTGRKTY